MKTFKIEDVTVTIPEYTVIMVDDVPYLKITEGKYEGIEFAYTDIKVNEEDESLVEYNLYTNANFNDSEVDDFQKVVNDIFLSVLARALKDTKEKQDA